MFEDINLYRNDILKFVMVTVRKLLDNPATGKGYIQIKRNELAHVDLDDFVDTSSPMSSSPHTRSTVSMSMDSSSTATTEKTAPSTIDNERKKTHTITEKPAASTTASGHKQPTTKTAKNAPTTTESGNKQAPTITESGNKQAPAITEKPVPIATHSERDQIVEGDAIDNAANESLLLPAFYAVKSFALATATTRYKRVDTTKLSLRKLHRAEEFVHNLNMLIDKQKGEQTKFSEDVAELRAIIAETVEKSALDRKEFKEGEKQLEALLSVFDSAIVWLSDVNHAWAITYIIKAEAKCAAEMESAPNYEQIASRLYSDMLRIMFNIKLDDLCEKTTNSGQVRMLPNPSAENIMKVVLEKLRVQFKLDQKEIDIDDKIEQLATLVDGLLNVVKTEQNDLESRRYLPDSAANIMAFTPLKRFVAQRNEPLDELIDLLSHYQAQVANLKLTSHNSPKVVLVVVGS